MKIKDECCQLSYYLCSVVGPGGGVSPGSEPHLRVGVDINEHLHPSHLRLDEL